MTKSIFIYRGPRYAIASYGNGWAYQVADLATGESVFLQDDDATRFRAAIDALEAAAPTMPMDRLFALAIEGECYA